MKSKKIISLISAITLTAYLLIASQLNVLASSADTKHATQTATADQDVVVNLTDDKIEYGPLNITNQATANGYKRTINSVDEYYVIFESQHDLGTPDSIVFNEGVTNANAFYKVNSSGEIYPASNGLDNKDWIYFRDGTSGTAYVTPQLSGSLSSGGGGVTMPGTVTEVGSTSFTQYYYTTADAGITWTRNQQTIYVALGNDNRLYVSNTPTLSETQYYTVKGEGRSDASISFGNSLALTSDFPTTATSTVTLDFGYNIPWDNTQSNASKSLYTLIDMPQHAATGHLWTWHLDVTGEYVSNP